MVTLVMLLVDVLAVIGAIAVVAVEGSGRFVKAGQAQYKMNAIMAFNAAVLAYGRSVRTYNIANGRLAKVMAFNAWHVGCGNNRMVHSIKIRQEWAQTASQFKREARLQMLVCKLDLNGFYDSPRR